MSHGKQFLNAVESSVMDSCYDVWQLLITQPSIKKEFIMTCTPDEWVFIAKDKRGTGTFIPQL